MEAVHILVGIYGQKTFVRIKALWQGQLQENAVHFGIVVETFYERQKLFLTCGGRKAVGDGAYACLIAGSFLVAHIDLGGRVLSHQYHCKARGTHAPLNGRGYLGCDFPADIRGRFLAIYKYHLPSLF